VACELKVMAWCCLSKVFVLESVHFYTEIRRVSFSLFGIYVLNLKKFVGTSDPEKRGDSNYIIIEHQAGFDQLSTITSTFPAPPFLFPLLDLCRATIMAKRVDIYTPFRYHLS